METIPFEGLILKVTPYMEKDVIITLLTREGLRVNAFARGAKVSIKRFGGSLDLFNFISGVFKKKGEDHLLELMESHVIESIQNDLRHDICKYALFSYAAEMVLEFLKESQSIHGVFEYFCQLSEQMRSEKVALTAVLVNLESEFIRLFGYWPHWDRCSRCGKNPDYLTSYYLKSDEGILFCMDCLKKSGQASGEFLVIKPEVLKSILDKEDQNPQSLKMKRVVFESLIHHVLGKKMKSHEFLNQVF